ncbi:MAG: hypothetical protein GX310_01715 [Synergistaceae bacterium]|nr:hypothetical protein [Synergistaceae bacterium]
MRHIVLFLSMGTVVLYGYALAGLGGYLLGRGRLDYIVFGILLGSLSAAAAILLWKKFLLTEEAGDQETEEKISGEE